MAEVIREGEFVAAISKRESVEKKLMPQRNPQPRDTAADTLRRTIDPMRNSPISMRARLASPFAVETMRLKTNPSGSIPAALASAR